MANVDDLASINETGVQDVLHSQASSPPSEPPPVTVMPSSSVETDSSPSSQGLDKGKEGTMESFPHEPVEISISGDDAKNIREASRSFNEALKLLLLEEEKDARKKARISKKEDHEDMHKSSDIKTEEDTIATDKNPNEKEESPSEEQQEKKEDDIADRTITSNTPSKSNESTSIDTSPAQVENSTDQQATMHEDDDHDLKLLQHRLFVQAAERSGNPLVESFLELIKGTFENDLKQIQICLLLFVNMDKSSKLISAFDIAVSSSETCAVKNEDSEMTEKETEQNKKRKHAKLETEETNTEKSVDTSSSSSKIDGDVVNSNEVMETRRGEKLLHRNDLVALFKCFLTSISSCIEENSENDSNFQTLNDLEKSCSLSNTPKLSTLSKPSSAVSPEIELSCTKVKAFALSKKKVNEIHHSAVYATEQLIKFTLDAEKENLERNALNKRVKLSEDDECASKPTLDNVPVSFENFGDWYNSGGFDLIPWVELLDLAKWQSLESVPNSEVEGKENSPPNKDISKDNSKDWEAHEENVEKTLKKVDSPLPEIEVGRIASQETNTVKQDDQNNPEAKSVDDSRRTKREPENKKAPKSTNKSSTQNTSASPAPSRSLVSFDFTSSLPSYYKTSDQPFCIDITAENLQMLKNLVLRTGLANMSPSEVCDILLRHQYNDQMDRTGFRNCVRELFPAAMDSSQFQQTELVTISKLFNTFFSCFDRDGNDIVNVRELSVGFSFLCSGNKSKKLAVSFDLLDVYHRGYLSGSGLCQYLRSYLTMLVGISYLTNSSSPQGKERDKKKADMILAVDSGAQRTQGHVLKSINTRKNQMNYSTRGDEQFITFEEFADWYTEGGYTVAPWLELLDLNKFLSLLESTPEADCYDPLATTAIGEPSVPSNQMTRLPPSSADGLSPFQSSSLPLSSNSTQRYSSTSERDRDKSVLHDSNAFEHAKSFQNDTLFTFPLAHKDSLLVTREDAHYVNSLVRQLKLLSFEPEDVFSTLKHAAAAKSRTRSTSNQIMIDRSTFIYAMKDLIDRTEKHRMEGQMEMEVTDKLRSLHESFDLRREGFVSLNELMGGLTLLCGGRKSAKLSFAFGLFNRVDSYDRNMNEASLDERDLFTFFRSFLIVLFSSCSQSLYLSAEKREHNICDTAHMVCRNVMKHQWHARRSERVNFDDFGEWYNVGGFEVAPWLELLDLTKWVLLDSPNPAPTTRHVSSQWFDYNSNSSSRKKDYESNDTSVESNIRRQIPPKRESRSYYRDNYEMGDGSYQNSHSSSSPFSESYHKSYKREKSGYSSSEQNYGNALKFNLLTTNDKKGFIVSIAQQRVSRIRHLVVESGLSRMDTASVCNRILENSLRSSDNKSEGPTRMLRKETLDHVIRNMIDYCSKEKAMPPNLQRNMSDTFMLIFDSFVRDRRSSADAVNANEFACGFSILCFGRKSDKLEYAFDLLDEDKVGKLSRRGMFIYLRSFLTVVMGLSISSYGSTFIGGELLMTMDGDLDNNTSIAHAIDAGAQWATDQVFRDHWRSSVTFDEFADWYTEGGYNSIPWLELLDLKKWVLVQT